MTLNAGQNKTRARQEKEKKTAAPDANHLTRTTPLLGKYRVRIDRTNPTPPGPPSCCPYFQSEKTIPLVRLVQAKCPGKTEKKKPKSPTSRKKPTFPDTWPSRNTTADKNVQRKDMRIYESRTDLKHTRTMRFLCGQPSARTERSKQGRARAARKYSTNAALERASTGERTRRARAARARRRLSTPHGPTRLRARHRCARNNAPGGLEARSFACRSCRGRDESLPTTTWTHAFDLRPAAKVFDVTRGLQVLSELLELVVALHAELSFHSGRSVAHP
jgi:hypothetical protein